MSSCPPHLPVCPGLNENTGSFLPYFVGIFFVLKASAANLHKKSNQAWYQKRVNHWQYNLKKMKFLENACEKIFATDAAGKHALLL